MEMASLFDDNGDRLTGGIVGIAVAKELSVNHGRKVLVVDSAPIFGTGTSFRNSEVIRVGIYCRPSSLKLAGISANSTGYLLPPLNSLSTSMRAMTFSYDTAVIGGNIGGNQIQIHVSGSNAIANWNGRSELDSELILIPKLVVNSAGLSVPAIAKRIEGLPNGIIPDSKYARGCYSRFQTLNPLSST
ncbi:putative protein FAR1-RELATED SEQUENCE 3-like [Capsicum annuum]|uniref:L-2-hydroxyglutarate dehydrogenase, mitochondrial n=1 Tax=Capsicum annuum TaxID=4072 RepID=A0A2G2YWG4_CAPAN|nr:putative protein FAR1-RELATED SEQUENCE 3-like [Capsicum annuum]KAF3626730.1 putative protein FAR1-RELATED SEQUENCE 3-like [Capsicum annuum]PHT74086.1 hypothetical protein T459_21363 [Capsicum annuum]